jgi:hypothetical protein
MKTVDRADSTEAFKRRLGSRMGLRITGAIEYWLEDGHGRVISEVSPFSGVVLSRILDEIGRGVSPDDIRMFARTSDLDRYDIGGGLDLQDIAEAAAGIPAEPRVLKS